MANPDWVADLESLLNRPDDQSLGSYSGDIGGGFLGYAGGYGGSQGVSGHGAGGSGDFGGFGGEYGSFGGSGGGNGGGGNGGGLGGSGGGQGGSDDDEGGDHDVGESDRSDVGGDPDARRRRAIRNYRSLRLHFPLRNAFDFYAGQEYHGSTGLRSRVGMKVREVLILP